MSIVGESFLNSEQLSEKDIDKIFTRAELFKREFQKRRRLDHLIKNKDDLAQKIVALVFAEPSTRTRVSFQIAAGRLGIRTIVLDNPIGVVLVQGRDSRRHAFATWPPCSPI